MMKTCSRGHRFKKSSDCPVCPKCWPGRYKKEMSGEFPSTVPAPALRALLNEKIITYKQLAKHSEADILDLHGMGPKALGQLKAALRSRGLSFKQVTKKYGK